MGISDELGAMICHHCRSGRNAWKNGFSRTGEACKEMRFDEAFCANQICIDHELVDDQVAAARQRPYVNQGGIVAVMNHNLFTCDDLFAELVDQLFLGSSSVTAGADQNGDIRFRIALSNLTKHWRNNYLAGNRSGVVRGD